MIDTIELFKIIKRMLESSSAPNVSISAIYTQYARCACAAIALSLSILMFETIPSLIKALVAPNLVIIEQLGGLIK